MKKIDKEIIEDILALTPMQEGMLFHYLKEQRGDLYFEQLSLELSGFLAREFFERAWNNVVQANPMLRTFFRWENLDKPAQVVLKQHSPDIRFYDLSTIQGPGPQRLRLETIKQQDREKGFDLRGVPFRVTLCKISETGHYVIISNHHILFDGWSTGIILKEFFQTYDKMCRGETVIPSLKTKFKEFIKWLQQHDKSGEALYWKNHLKGVDRPLGLPVKSKSGPGGGEQGVGRGRYRTGFEKSTTGKLVQFTVRHKVTLAALLYTAWGVLLQRYTGGGDVLFGTTVSGRTAGLKGIEDMVGLFINTVPLRVRGIGEEDIITLTRRTGETLRQREPYTTAALVDIKKYGEIDGKETLFDTIVVLENYPLDRMLAAGRKLIVRSYSMEEQTHYDVTVGIAQKEDHIDVTFGYREELFAEETVKRMAGHWQCILRDMIENPHREVRDIDMLPPGEKKRLLMDFNNTESPFPADKTLTRLFEEHAERTPDRTALVSHVPVPMSPMSLTYRRLNESSNRLAHLLRQKGVKPDTIVPIMTERSPEMIVGILGILKAGGAYLPIDPGYPGDRIRYLLKDSASKLLLFQQKNVEFVGALDFDGEAVCLESASSDRGDSQNPACVNSPKDLAYIIYTSGSTGLPKGVMVKHISAVNLLTALHKKYPLEESDIYLLKTTFLFDVSIAEIFGWFREGGRLSVLEPGKEKDPYHILDSIEAEGITHINFVPSMFNLFVEILSPRNINKLSGLKYIFLAGEDIWPESIKRFRQLESGVIIENLYGPTEAAVYASRYPVAGWGGVGRVPIGIPIDNVKLYILGTDGGAPYSLQPPGVPGELCISGIGLACGYANRPELSAEKFLVFYRSYRTNRTYIPSRKIYKTGDLARWLPDGNIEFLGRKDLQVKIRGFRIEPGEIERQLSKHEAVKDALVIAREYESGEKYLCAYVVMKSHSPHSLNFLKEYLSGKLPDYMVPANFVLLERIPLNPNGKVDVRALPGPEVASVKEYIPPRNDTERELVNIWADVLGIDGRRIGIDDDFFELGGHSLKATVLILRIQKVLEVKVHLDEIFKLPTIRRLAGYIKELTKEEHLSIEPAEEKEFYPLSPGQRRLYFLQQMDKTAAAYNMPSVWLLKGAVDKKRMEYTFKRLIRRHESLRTSFIMVEEEPVQQVYGETVISHWSLVIGEAGKSEIEDRIKNFIKPFDLSRAPLLRVGLIELPHTPGHEYILMVDMHHIICDGVSVEIIVNEFTALWTDKELQPIKLQYKDYGEWQNSDNMRRLIEYREKFWLNRFADEFPRLSLPADYVKPVVRDFEGNIAKFRVTGEEYRALKTCAYEQEVTLYMLLLAVYNIFLSKICGQEDIIVGTGTAGRRHADLEPVVGMFVNTLVLRNFPRHEYTFKQYLNEVKERTLEAFANQDYPYEDLAAAAGVKFDTMFAMQDAGNIEIKIPGLEIKSYEFHTSTAKFDLMLLVFEESKKENLSFTFEYSTTLFKEETIQGFSGFFKRIAAAAAEQPGIRISEIEIISETERERILFEFNDPGFARQYPEDKTIQQLFAEQAAKGPDRIAVIGRAQDTGCCALSYRELNEKSGRLARGLREKGVLADNIVGIMVERSLEMITGILGILKAGGAYLPIDPTYPRERIDYMLKDSGANILLKQQEIAGFSSPEAFITRPKGAPLAYVVYTSGSTGQPKGILTTHYNVVRVVRNTNYIDLNDRDVILQLSNYAFDGSIFDIYGALLNGGRLVLVGKETVPDIKGLAAVIVRESISAFFTTTALFNAIVDIGIECLASVRKVLFGGERVSEAHVRKAFDFLGPGRLLHVYGPTETTVFASCYEIDEISADADNVPIGKGITATTLYILNKNNRLQPVGIPGELYIAGAGLARGYLNRPELTAEKFDRDLWDYQDYRDEKKKKNYQKFFGGDCIPGRRRLYKTGDLVKWLADGNIEFIGRIDQQVKIRGFRIEPGEIESHLLKHPLIKEVFVLVKEDNKKGKYLCAYIAADGENNEKLLRGVQGGGFLEKSPPGGPELREYLSQILPAYMIPSYFVFLDKIPLTINGKVDRKALPEPESVSEEDKYTAARDDVEVKMAALWAGVLGMEKDLIGIDRDFFELGGHSLKAAVLAARIHKAFDVSVPLREIFTNPTIRGLASYIKKAAVSGHISIEPLEKKEYYPLSPAQKRLYVLQQMDEHDGGMGTVYNIPAVWTVEGDVNKKRLAETFNRLIRRHESLRTSFHLVNNEPVQKIHEEVKFEIEYFSAAIRPFDPARAPLLRVGLIEPAHTSEHTCILMVDMHHIISDGASIGILVSEFMALYKGEELPALEIQYKDFAGWQNSRQVKESLKPQQEYWQNQFKGEIPVLDLPTDYVRPPVRSFTGRSLEFEIDREDTRALKSCAHQRGTTLYMILLAAFNLFLAKITNRESIIVGTVAAARRHADLENIIGMFVNTLGLINSPQNRMYFHEFLETVKDRTLAAFENQDYPFEELVEQAGLTLTRDTGRNPLFDVMFVFQNIEIKDIEIPGLKLKPRQYENPTAKFDLTLNGREKQDGLHFIVEYCTALFKETTIQRFINYFKTIISFLAANLENPIKIRDIDVLSREEKQRLLIDFNRTEAGYPEGKTIHELFEEQAARTPDGAAVSGHGCMDAWMHEGILITYRELNKKSIQLAYLLKEKGVLADSIVGIKMERSVEMIIGILGILKAGGAYLPIDPEYPQERIDYMLKDSGAKLLVTTNNLEAHDFSFLPATGHRPPATSLAYIIYTSGTTGKPKGVMIEHKNVVRLMFNDKFQFDFNDKDVWTMFHSYCFDFSVWEMYGSLLYGARLVVVPRMAARDTALFLELLRKETVTVLNQTPSAFYRLIEEELKLEKNDLDLKYVIFGGEALNPLKLKKWKNRYPDTRLINMFGITETTVHVTYKEIAEQEIDSGVSNIGKPIPTLCAYVVDSSLSLVPIGVPGELCVGGEGVGRGYLNRPELTAEKFLDCYRSYRTYRTYIPSKKIYKSGDRVRVLADGDLEYLGRVDHQVKIRGFRIEPGEIENHLLKHPRIKEAVVMVKKKEPLDNYLCAYIVSDTDIPLAVSELRDYLSKNLPDYMIPSYFVPLAEIPLTANGKIDWKALPEPDRKAATEDYTAPRTETEKILTGLWAEVLERDNGTIGIDDSFFDLGGHSLKAALLTSRIHHRLKVKIPLVEVFRTPTIRALARLVKESAEDRQIPVVPVETREYYALSSAQRRLYILYRMDELGIAYNMPTLWILEGGVDKNRLENTFHRLILRHESLRTSFHMIKNEMVQKIHKEVELVIGEEKSMETIIQDFVHPFDLARASLLRVGLIEIEEQKHLLAVDMHHIISDGISMGILLKEFMSLYSGEQAALPFIPLTYKDFAQWQHSQKNSEKLKQQEAFWVKEFAGEIPVLDLPTDYTRPSAQSFEGHIVEFDPGDENTRALKEIAAQEGVTLFILLLSLYNILLAKICGQEDIIVGVDTAGRHHPHLQPIIGMFVNTLALRNFPTPGKRFSRWLQEVKEKTLKAFDRQDYQFEDLVERIEVNRDPSRNPLFDVMFSFMETADTGLDIRKTAALLKENIKIKPYPHERAAALFDLTLNGREDGEGLYFSFQYCTKLFKEKTIHRFISFFKQIISAVTRDRNRPISGIEIISAEEKKQVLFDFNNTGTPLKRDKNYIRLFEEQVTGTPDKIAVVFNDHQVTYRRLNEEADRIASILSEYGVTVNIIASVLLERSIEMLAALLGIFKTGGVYLPLETDYPVERVKTILKDSEARVLITVSPFSVPVEEGNPVKIVDVRWPASVPSVPSVANSHPHPEPAHVSSLAYIIYTSGSTGKPKGVMIRQLGMLNHLYAKINDLGITSEDIIAQTASACFDISVWQFLAALLVGGATRIIPRETILEPVKFLQVLRQGRVTILESVPSLMTAFIEAAAKESNNTLKHLRWMMATGEPLKAPLVREWLRVYPCIKPVNAYGPTEASDDVTHYIIDDIPPEDQTSIPIGKPLRNLHIYILDKNLSLCPVGIKGEICVAGIGVGKGYWKDEPKTKAAFIPNPFLGDVGDNDYAVLYKTGDIGYFRDDGNIECLGRLDHQVKIRGNRIELGEIENRLLSRDSITDAVVVNRTDAGGQDYLCAYIVVGHTPPGANELKEYLRQTLPDYMVPPVFVTMDRLPVSSSGKLDRKALPEPEAMPGREYLSPGTDTERKIAAVWQEVLKRDKIGINDNFFSIGGTSITIIQVGTRLRELFNRDLPVVKLFEYTTIRALANYLEQQQKENRHSEPGDEMEDFESFRDESMNIFEQTMEIIKNNE